jgi:SAM-dependent methyltransferase
VSNSEFEHGADDWRRLLRLERSDAVSEACRGSGNPAVLAWLAEALELGDSSCVIDIGGGLGGPCAWLHDHYGCGAVSVDPVADAARCAGVVFDVPSIVGEGSHLPFPDARFDAALLLGVLSVVDDPVAVMRDAARVADRLGLLVYCSTGSEAVERGGSVFVTRAVLADLVEDAGWAFAAGPAEPALPPPPSWASDGPEDTADDADEQAVAEALDDERIEALVATATPIGARHR